MSRVARLLSSVIRMPAKKGPPPGVWGPLAAPVDPLETHVRMRAQSILAGETYRDGSTNPGTVTLEQAMSVINWNSTK